MAPSDSEQVLWAIRLGWYMAEVRGRNRPNGPKPLGNRMPSRVDGDLPLRMERSPTELRIEAQTTLAALAVKLGVDKDPNNVAVDVARVDQLAAGLQGWRKEQNVAAADATWGQLRELLFKLDAHVQDTLTASSDTQACGYQLGRGLSEAYWGLDVEPPLQDATSPPVTGWAFLLGQERCQELSRLAGRLSAYFPSYTGPAVAGTLSAWAEVASDSAWRQVSEARDMLYQQSRRWYELTVLLQDPSTLLKPYQAVRNIGALWRAARALWLQIVIGVASLVAVTVFIEIVTTNHTNRFGAGLFGILGAIGVSATTFTTRLKNTAQALTTRIKQDVYTDLIAIAVTIVPARPGGLTGSQRRDYRVRRAVKRRTITSETSATI